MPSGWTALDEHKNSPPLLALPHTGQVNEPSALDALSAGGRDSERTLQLTTADGDEGYAVLARLVEGLVGDLMLHAVAPAGIGRRPQALDWCGHSRHLSSGVERGGGDRSGSAASTAAMGRQTGEGA